MAIQTSYQRQPFNVIVVYYYEGKMIDDISQLIKENPELDKMYAKHKFKVQEKRKYWYANTSIGYKTVIRVTENDFTVHPDEILIR